MKLNFEIKERHKQDAIRFVQKYHYSPVMPVLTKHYLGFHLDGKLVGVLTLGWGTQPKATINKMFPGLSTEHYYEIGKMCLVPELNGTKGAGSQMVSATIKWMKENTDRLFLYTMADGIMGKCGYVYQASNFYFGEKYWTSVYMMENGEKLHPRSTKELCKENAIFSKKKKVFWLTKDFMLHKDISKIKGYMFRYIYPLNKKAKKIMKRRNPSLDKTKKPQNYSKLDWSLNYPKNEDLEWMDVTDSKNKKVINKPAFTYEDAKYNVKNINQVSTLPVE